MPKGHHTSPRYAGTPKGRILKPPTKNMQFRVPEKHFKEIKARVKIEICRIVKELLKLNQIIDENNRNLSE